MTKILLTTACILAALPIAAQKFANYTTYPTARTSFLRSSQLVGGTGGVFRDSSLLAFWPITAGPFRKSDFDLSGNGNTVFWSGTGTGVSSTYYTTGMTYPYSGIYDSTTTILNTTHNITVGGTITLIAWAKRNWGSGSTYYGMVSSQDYGQLEGATFTVAMQTDTVNAEWNSGDAICFGNGYLNTHNPSASAAMGTLTANTWHMLACVVGSATPQIYLDGSALTMRHAVGFPTPSITFPWYIGSEGGTLRFWDGQLSGVRVYSRGLTTTEIQSIYNAEKH